LKLPTAVQDRAETQDTPLSESKEPCGALGLGTMVHRVPFQDSAKVSERPRNPTAVQALGERQDTPSRTVSDLCGLGTMAHLVPFHDSMRVLAAAPEAWKFPTAVQDRAETQETALSSLEAPAGPAWGVGTSFQARP